jgi:hypothetical protein
MDWKVGYPPVGTVNALLATTLEGDIITVEGPRTDTVGSSLCLGTSGRIDCRGRLHCTQP